MKAAKLFEHPLILLQTIADVLFPLSLASTEVTFLLLLVAIIFFGTFYSEKFRTKNYEL